MDQKVVSIVLIAVLSLVMIALAQIVPPDAGNSTAKQNITIAPSNQSVNISNGSYVEGELHVRFDPAVYNSTGMIEGASMKAHAAIGSLLLNGYDGLPGLQLVRLPAGMTVEEGIAYYKKIPGVLYAEVNSIYSIENSPTKANTTQSPKPAGNQTQGEILVRFNVSAFETPAALQTYENTTNSAINATVLTDYTQYGMPGLQLIKLSANMTQAQGIAYYQGKPNVLYAEPNSQFQISANQTVNQTAH
jgi:hypothetical protein